jgi:hypothetical protein
MFVELWGESKATPRLFERRIKDKVKEIKTFVTTDCLIVMFFPFGFRLLSHFSCAVPARFSHFDKLVYRLKIISLRLSACKLHELND